MPIGTQHGAPSMDRTQDLSISSLMLHQATALTINSCAICICKIATDHSNEDSVPFNTAIWPYYGGFCCKLVGQVPILHPDTLQCYVSIHRYMYQGKHGWRNSRLVDKEKSDNNFLNSIWCARWRSYKVSVLTSTHNLCFGAKIREIGIPLHSPVLLYEIGA